LAVVPPTRRFAGALTSLMEGAPVAAADGWPQASFFLTLPSAYHRLLLHGAAQFYCLSTTTEAGSRMRVSHTKRTEGAVRPSLVAFLGTLRPDLAA
jgi:hypothetical protein